MRFIKYIALSLVFVASFACKKEETMTFDSLPSFEFKDTIISVPFKFFNVGDVFKKDMEVYLMGKLPESDINLKLNYNGSTPEEDYISPKEIVFPKGKVKTSFNIEIPCTQKIKDGTATDFYITITESEGNTNGIRYKAHVLIEVETPTRWVGHTVDNRYVFENIFPKCSQARYDFLFKVTGEYDIAVLIPEITLDVSKEISVIKSRTTALVNWLNREIKNENAILASQGKGPLKDDDGKTDLAF